MLTFRNVLLLTAVLPVLAAAPRVSAAGYEFVEGYNVLDTNNAPAIGADFAATAGFERDIAVDSARGIIYIARGQQTTTDGRPGVSTVGIAAIVVTNGARAGSNFRDTGLITPVGGWCQSLAYDPVSDKLWALGGPLGSRPVIYSAPGGTLGGSPNGDGISSVNPAFTQAFQVDSNLLETGVFINPQVSTNGTPPRGGSPRGLAVRTVGGVTTVYLGMGNHVEAWSNDGTNSTWHRIWATMRVPAQSLISSRVAAAFTGVNGVAVDDAGNCYFSVYGNGGRIWTVRPGFVQSAADPLSLDFNDTSLGGNNEREVLPLIISGSAAVAVTNTPQAITFCRFDTQRSLFISFIPSATQRAVTRVDVENDFALVDGGTAVRAAAVNGFGSGQPAVGQDSILSGIRLKQSANSQPQGTSNNLLYHDVDSIADPSYLYAVAFVIDTNKGQTVPTAAVIKVALSTDTNPPSILIQPANQTLLEGGTINLSVSASGLKPLHYQWQSNMVNIVDATNASYTVRPASTNHSGLYQVIVSNALGSITSTQVQVTVNPLVRSEAMTDPSWRLAPGSVPFLTTDNTQRGLTYNPASGRVLVVSRAGGSNTVASLNAEDPLADPWYLGMDGDVLNPPAVTLALNMIGASEDGVVYACSLGQATNLFRIYRWGNDEANIPPDLAFSAPANSLGAPRWGDSFDVRGSTADNTLQILAGSRNNDVVTLFTTADNGVTLQTNTVRVPAAPNGAFGLSVSFGHGNTFWAKGDGATGLRLVQFDLANGTGAVVRTYGQANFPLGATIVGFDRERNVLAAISLENPDNLRLYDMSDLDAGPRLVDQELFPTDNENLNATGAIDFSGSQVFALDSNNGIIAYTLGTIPTGPPGRINISRSGNSVTLTWTGNYTLQSATGVTNTFTDVVGAASGHTENVSTATEKYFRLRN